VTWVDGGLLSNFPITVFDRTDGKQPRWPTWGDQASGQPLVTRDQPVRGALGIAVNRLETLTADWNRYRLDEDGVNRRTIFVDTIGVAATNFDIDKVARQRLYDNGRSAGQKFLARSRVKARLSGSGTSARPLPCPGMHDNDP
jgi:NTE family protein